MPDFISLDRIASYPADLSRISTEPGVLLMNPLSELSALRSLDRFSAPHRESLVAALLHDMKRWNAPDAALESVEQLRSEDSYAVVTGQQAGIATGPLYTLYKAIGTVLAARQLKELHPEHRFVPVFWIEGDDHDFEEARKLTVLDRAGEPATVAYDDGLERSLHVGDRKNSAQGIEALVEQLRELLLPTEFTDAALDILRTAYGGADETLADGFARSLYALLGDTPLVLASSRNSGLKRLAADIFAAEARDPQLLSDAVAARTEQVKNDGWQTPITPKTGSLFITYEGERRALDYEEGVYKVRGTDVTYSAAQAETLARETPEIFSPNVVLRPIVQDAIFPTAIYLGGPSEVAYLNQIRDGYTRFGLEAPAVAPRPFVLLLEPKIRRIMEVLNVTLETLLADEFDAATLMIDETVDAELEKAKDEALAKLAEAYSAMAAITTQIDPTLEKTLGAAEAGASKGIEDFTKRLRSVLKKKQSTEIEKLGLARQMVMPKEHLQERELNALYYINKYGMERFRQALEEIELKEGEMQVVDL